MIVICFISQWMKRSKHGFFVFPLKKTVYVEGIVRLANRVAVWRQSEVSVDFYEVLRAWSFFHPSVRLTNPIKAMHVCTRSINRTNISLSRSSVVSVLFCFVYFKVIRQIALKYYISSKVLLGLFLLTCKEVWVLTRVLAESSVTASQFGLVHAR